MGNPRRSNGSRRTSTLAWLRSLGAPCHICGMPIHYGAPAGDPLAFECDELVPVSRGGSPYDRSNVAAAHRCCNNWRGARSMSEVGAVRVLVSSRLGGWTSPLEFVRKARAAAKGSACTPIASHGQPRTTTDW